MRTVFAGLGGNMKAILISIKPKWCEAIASGEKTIEVRKTCPKIKTPFRCYIYETNNIKGVQGFSVLGRYRVGKVIGEFICDKVYLIKNQGSRFSVADEEQSVTNEIARQSCLDYDDMVSYLGNKDGYGLHITNLKIYDKPKELSDYIRGCRQPDEIQCENCPYCNWNDVHFCTDKRRTITRPPQSWCYVEV